MKIEVPIHKKTTISLIATAALTANSLTKILKSISDLDSVESDKIQKRTLQKLYYNAGYFFGGIKATIDCLPESVDKQNMQQNIKNAVMKYVPIKDLAIITNAFGCDYWKRYRRMSEDVCGYGSTMNYNEERLKYILQENPYQFIIGFARGYSYCFHIIAYDAGIVTRLTDPILQDIFKNHPYFTDSSYMMYSLEGPYIYPYTGNWNSVVKLSEIVFPVNQGVYASLRKHVDSIELISFDIDF